MAHLEVRGVRKSFGGERPAVDGVSLTVASGEILCLLGPSGCGKTTLLRLVAGLETADEGEIWLDGRRIDKVSPHLRDFGMMFQDFALFPHRDVAGNVAFGLQMHGRPAIEVAALVEQTLKLVDLSGFGERDVSSLSGGEQQRVALARSLAPQPRLLMLDEPLGALDRALRERLMIQLRQILKQVGVTSLYVTHDQTEAFAVGDRIAVMNRGRIEQLDEPQRIFGLPATPFVARFLGFQNLIPGEVNDDDQVVTRLGAWRLDQELPPAGAPVTLLIRPEAAQPVGGGADSKVGVLEARVTAISFRGRYYQVWMQARDQVLLFEMDEPPGRSGDLVRVRLDPGALRVLPALAD
jgi:ABC-type Fe3+/spermidine/putrescine transport system ATPase subunit